MPRPEAEHRRHDHPAPSSVLARAEPDRDERLAERDDHDQAMPLGEMRRVDTPAAHAAEQRPDEPDDEAASHSTGLSPPATNAATTISAAPATCTSHPQHSRQQIRLGPACQRKQPDEHDAARPEKRSAKTRRWLPKASGTASAATNSAAVATSITASTIPHPRRPCSSARRSSPTPTTARANTSNPRPSPPHVGSSSQQRRHLREREHEHEVEEQLDRRHPAVQLGVKLGHNPTVTRTRWRRETNRWIHPSHEYTLVLSLRPTGVIPGTLDPSEPNFPALCDCSRPP